jgi:hypothetical protein
MARRELSIFVSGRSERDWRVVSMMGEFGPFSTREQATEEALRQAMIHHPARVLVQNALGNYVLASEPQLANSLHAAVGAMAL